MALACIDSKKNLNLTGKERPSLNVVHENTLKCSKLADFFFRQQKIESAVNMLKTVTVKKIVDTVVKHYCVYYPFNCNTL